ncbi:MAG: inositol monophosphatase family protein [Fimbriimonadaceae bacterium]|nr:inositol monophosphatase family protein [Fimbriimonadaceae bacterium]
MPMDLARLTEITQQAGAIARQMWHEAEIETKDGGSIVTVADRETERFLREALRDLVPGAAFWGEEFGGEAPTEAGLWLLDPIDGTSNYAHGIPFWGVSVALWRNGRLEAGVIDLPDLDETLVGHIGQAPTLNGEPLPPVRSGGIEPHELVGHNFRSARAGVGNARLFGAFVIEGAFVATGRLRALFAGGESLYDVAAAVVIAEGVGLEISDRAGRPMDWSQYLSGQSLPDWQMRPPIR